LVGVAVLLVLAGRSTAEDAVIVPPIPGPQALASPTGVLDIPEGDDDAPLRFVGGWAGNQEAFFLETTRSLLVRVSPDGSVSTVELRPPRADGFVEPDVEPEVTDLVAVADGTLLVGDMAKGAIWRYSRAGTFLGSFLNDRQTRDARLERPLGLGLGTDGRVAVVDGADHSVKVLAPDGDLLFATGGQGTAPGSFSFPNDVAVSPSGLLFVADSNNRRIQVLNEEGEFVRAFRATDAPEGLQLPRSLAFDSRGRLHVADTLAGRMEVYSEEGENLGNYGSDGGLVYPEASAILGFTVLIGDRGSGELVSFALTP
jgi:sugar lactone lactonase YvrE